MATFPDQWDDGTATDGPAHQVHWYDERTAIIRQSLRTNFEGPFLYLLLGSERALLLDTGTGDTRLRELIDELLAGRDLELVVAHTHAHGDHVGGDAQFDEVVGHSAEEVAGFFGIADWPDGIGRLDLGERVLDVIAIPGHQGSDIALYDARTGLLFTGDSLYPGRLYVPDWASYRASVRRLTGFVAAGNHVEWVLGAHIEMTDRPGEDYPMGADVHPAEHPLQLDAQTLTELDEALSDAGPEPHRLVHDHFIVVPR
jgi:glyoxylase-like metal-dependent hydrolase (beta-lactamase superfamily II)